MRKGKAIKTDPASRKTNKQKKTDQRNSLGVQTKTKLLTPEQQNSWLQAQRKKALEEASPRQVGQKPSTEQQSVEY